MARLSSEVGCPDLAGKVLLSLVVTEVTTKRSSGFWALFLRILQLVVSSLPIVPVLLVIPMICMTGNISQAAVY